MESRYSSLVSRDAIDFLIYILNVDPQKRPTATEALNHPYLAQKEQISVNNEGKNDISIEDEIEEDILFNKSKSRNFFIFIFHYFCFLF